MVQPLWKRVWRFLKKLKIELPYVPAFPLLDIHPEETKDLIQKDTYTPMFIAALFAIPKTWQLPKCPLADKWTKTLNIYTCTHTHTHTHTYIYMCICVCVYIYIYIYTHTHICREASHMPLEVKNPLAHAGDIRDVGSIPELERPLEKEMATHSSILA